jgi:hypothetical protein
VEVMMNENDMARGTLTWLLIASGYIVVAAGVIGGMIAVRNRAIANMSTPEAEAEWHAYREKLASENNEGGPVQHVIPSSNEPPLLILMRDHFVPTLLALLIPATALYGVVVWMAWGVRRNSWQPDTEKP